MSHLVAAYCVSYLLLPPLGICHWLCMLDQSAFTLSVQFLNRVTYVVDLVLGRDLVGKLGKA